MLTTSLSSFPYDGGFFLVGLSVGGVVLAAVAAPRSIVPRVLSVSPVRYVGRISYGLYIWHWPIFLWLNGQRTGLQSYELFAVRVLVTFAVSVVSFHLIERPIRMGTFVSQWRAWLVVPAGVGGVLVAVFLATTGLSAGAGAGTALPPAPPTGSTTTSATTSSVPGATVNGGPAVKVLLVGDSIAQTLGEGLGEPTVQDRYDYVLYDRAILGCGVADGTQVIDRGQLDTVVPACGGPPAPGAPLNETIPWATQWAQEIAQIHPNVVVEGAGRWEVVDRLYQGTMTNILQPTFAAYVKSQLEKAAAVANSAGVPHGVLDGSVHRRGRATGWCPLARRQSGSASRRTTICSARWPPSIHTTVSVADLDKAACPGGQLLRHGQGVEIRTIDDGVHFTPQGASSWRR